MTHRVKRDGMLSRQSWNRKSRSNKNRTEQRGKTEIWKQVERERWRMEDGNEGDGVVEDGGKSDEGCWL